MSENHKLKLVHKCDPDTNIKAKTKGKTFSFSFSANIKKVNMFNTLTTKYLQNAKAKW